MVGLRSSDRFLRAFPRLWNSWNVEGPGRSCAPSSLWVLVMLTKWGEDQAQLFEANQACVGVGAGFCSWEFTKLCWAPAASSRSLSTDNYQLSHWWHELVEGGKAQNPGLQLKWQWWNFKNHLYTSQRLFFLKQPLLFKDGLSSKNSYGFQQPSQASSLLYSR